MDNTVIGVFMTGIHFENSNFLNGLLNTRQFDREIEPNMGATICRRKLIANQVIEKELEDGGLIVSMKVGHENQVLPIVRYWIPHIRVISPEGLQKELEKDLRKYLERVGC